MNKNKELINFIAKIDESDKIDCCDDLLDDAIKILKKKKSIAKELFPLLNKQVDAILDLTPYGLRRFNSNEILKGMPFECYSLHLQSKEFNIRILGAYIENVFYMLVMFEEKSGKRATDYTRPKEKARRRFEKLCLQKKKD